MKSFKRILIDPGKNKVLKFSRKLSSLENSSAWIKTAKNSILPKPIHGEDTSRKPFTLPILLTSRDAIGWLTANGLSLTEISKRAGISQGKVSEVSRGLKPGNKYKDALVKLATEICIEIRTSGMAVTIEGDYPVGSPQRQRQKEISDKLLEQEAL